MTDMEKRTAAARFAADWKGRGDEKQETSLFWIALLQKVCGVKEPDKYIAFELPVKLDHTSFIDDYIESTRVLIEQKGREVNLSRGCKQSDGALLTPFQQARRYAGYLPHNQNPRWIVVCNFLQFLVDTGSEYIKKEMEISLQAGELAGALYDPLLKQYKDLSHHLPSAQSQSGLLMKTF